jgi:hypothetical protein
MHRQISWRYVLSALVVLGWCSFQTGARLYADSCNESVSCGETSVSCSCQGLGCSCSGWGSGCGAGVSCSCADGCAGGGDCPPCP